MRGTLTAGRFRLSLLGAVLAIIAVFCLTAVSGWHGATIHDDGIHDDGIHVAALEHDHESSAPDLDGAAHVLAHACGQWLTATAPCAMPVAAIADRDAWSAPPVLLYLGIVPSGLLRPPRS